MPPLAYPDDNWDKDEYLKDVKWFQKDMAAVSRMNLTRKQRICCRKITETITESINILKDCRQKLSNTNKQRLYELAESRWRDYGSFFIEE